MTDAERRPVEAGLRSSDAFVLRRCQVLLASARGERAPAIARQLGCDDRTVRDAIHAFNDLMPYGQGFIALAAFYFGDARPALTALGAVIFGVFEAAGFRLGSSGVPSQLVQMLPYLVVVISLTLVAVRRELRVRERARAAAA